TASDPNGKPVTLTFVWTKNGVVVKTTSNTASTTDTLDLGVTGNGDKGDVIGVAITPNNGSLNGATVSSTTTVVNSPPTVAVALAPGSPTTSQTLTATATPFDADKDLVTLTYVWSVNGTVVKTTPSTTA